MYKGGGAKSQTLAKGHKLLTTVKFNIGCQPGILPALKAIGRRQLQRSITHN
jgi:hypothetical protein